MEDENVILVAAGRPVDITDEAERFCIALLSVLGQQTCERRSLSHAVKSEIQLRIGQCNDALQAIRLTIAKKAMLFRSEVRPAVNKKHKTRAYHKVQAAEASLRCQAQIYRKSRAALKSLNAPPEVLDRFNELSTED
jgi:hypothetical protein